jgi:hypothetical protein
MILEKAGLVLWHGLALSIGDAIYAHQTSKDAWPQAPTPVEHFALGPVALLVAQSWAIPDTPYLPSAAWWRRLRRLSDRGLVRVVRLVEGRMALLDGQWRDAWRRFLLPGLLQEVRRRQRRPRDSSRLESNAPINVLATMRRLTGDFGKERRGEWWFRCPFHQEKTASLSVNPERQVWYCLGCARGGGWKDLQGLAA